MVAVSREPESVPGSTSSKGVESLMIFITVKFNVKPERAEEWLPLVDDFTRATRNEPGNLWFEWSRSVETPNEFVLVEAFRDDAAGAHVNSDHFRQAMETMRPALVDTPRIVNFKVPGNVWSRMGELEIT
jgi:quinol monooxygenase YgiN